LNVCLVEHTTRKLLDEIRVATIDVAFLRPAAGEADELTTRQLPDEELWVALKKEHPMAHRREINLAELSKEPFVLFPRENGRLLYDSIIAACRNAGFSPRIVQNAPQLTSTVNLVATGMGVALVPASLCLVQRDRVSYAHIAGGGPRAELWVAHRSSGPVPQSVRNFMVCVDRCINGAKARRRTTSAPQRNK
jgi:DNA-binding transcriptional LysR family regulator